jgi:hypothetical protein
MYLVCYIDGGLGNSLSHFFYCVYLSQKYNLQLVALKVQSPNCNFDLSKYFDIPPSIKYINIEIPSHILRINNSDRVKLSQSLNNFLELYKIETIVFHDQTILNSLQLNSTRKKLVHVNRIDQGFFKYTNCFYMNNYYLHRKIKADMRKYIWKSKLKINDALRFEMDKVAVNRSFVGIHYRGTDNPHKMPIKQYIALLKSKIDTFAKVFICSDEREAEQMISQAFPNNTKLKKDNYVQILDQNLLTYTRNLNRNEESCKLAFMDAFLLGKTNIFDDGLESTFRDLGIICNYLFS